jgi:predicted membrane-bound mannosyltransferase
VPKATCNSSSKHGLLRRPCRAPTSVKQISESGRVSVAHCWASGCQLQQEHLCAAPVS